MDESRSEWLKLKRAKYDLNAFDVTMREFIQRVPYEMLIRFVGDREVRQGIVTLHVKESLPDETFGVFGDVLQNCRSALDHLMWRLVTTQKPGYDDVVYFPAYYDPDKFEAIGKRYAKLVGEDAWTLIKTVQPCETGDDTLFVLHELNRIDKHRRIPTTQQVSFPTAFKIKWGERTKTPEVLDVRVSRQFAIKEGAEIFTFGASHIAPADNVHVEAQFATSWVIARDFPEAPGRNIPELMNRIITTVEDVLRKF